MTPEANSPVESAHITPQSWLIPTIKAWSYYLADQGNSPYTVKAFIADLNLLASYLPPDKPIGNITTIDLNNFLDWMLRDRGVPCSPKTLSRRITSIKAFFRWLNRAGVLLIDPAEKVLQKTAISPLQEVLTKAETQKVLEAALAHRQAAHADTRPYALVKLLLDTGIKKGECLNINLNHIDLESPAQPMLFVRYASPQHRYKERKIALTEDWVSAYQEYKTQYNLIEPLFPWSPRRLEYLLEDLSNEAGLKKHLSFDMCRWTCVLNDWRTEPDRNKIRQKMGISKIQWREISAKLERLAEANPE